MFNNYSNCWNDKNKGKGKNNLANGGASNKEVI